MRIQGLFPFPLDKTLMIPEWCLFFWTFEEDYKLAHLNIKAICHVLCHVEMDVVDFLVGDVSAGGHAQEGSHLN